MRWTRNARLFAKLKARDATVRGQAFNLGGGVENAATVLEVLAEIERLTGTRLLLERADWRPCDQRYFATDTNKIRLALDLKTPKPWRRSLSRLLAWQRNHHTPALQPCEEDARP